MARYQVSTREKEQLAVHLPITGTPAATELEAAISAFRPISLQEMDSVALLNRVDTKFVLSTSQLAAALRSIQYRYQILTISRQRVHHYRTLYFDTREFDLYHDHVTGRAEIYKVRSREYLDTRISFLEVKHKNQKKRTEKSRMPIPYHSQGIDSGMENFLHGFSPFSGEDLEPKLWNTFKRITLVNTTDLERLTIDLDLCFSNEQGEIHLDGIAIAEIKQEHFSKESAFIAEMRRQGIRQTGFSKYCFGVSQLYKSVKRNSQKERALMIERIQHRGYDHVCFA